MSRNPGSHTSRPEQALPEAEALFAPLKREVAQLGWTIAGTAAESGRPSWMYTIGLLSTYDHPEFVLVGLDELPREMLLAQLAMRVAGGEQFTSGTEVEVGRSRVELGWVHPRHFKLDTFDMWEPLMQMHLHHFRPRALQVLSSDPAAPSTRRRWRLSTPELIR